MIKCSSNPSTKVHSCCSWRKTIEGIDIDRIGNVMDWPRLMFIDEEYGNLIVDVRWLTRNNNRKRKSEVLQVYRCPHFDRCYKRDWGKYDLSCSYIFCGQVRK